MDDYLFYVKPSTAKAQGGDKFRRSHVSVG